MASSTELTGMALRDVATNSGRLGATWAVHQRGLARFWLADIGFDWLDLAALCALAGSIDPPPTTFRALAGSIDCPNDTIGNKN